jgi:hypothetical protein
MSKIDDRNQTSHIYSEEASRKIFSRIKKSYSPAFNKLITELKKLSI